MHVFLSYQEITDSSITVGSFSVKEQEDTNGLKLLEEVDVSSAFLKPIKKNKKIEESKTLVQDSIIYYGIKNEERIPIRNVEIKTEQALPQGKLFDPTLHQIEFGSWQTILLILALLLLGFAKAFSNSRFKQTLKAFINYGIAQEITREEKVFFHRVNVFLTSIHLLIMALFLYHLKDIIPLGEIDVSPFVHYLIILGFILFMYIIKYIFSLLLFFIFDEVSISLEYVFNISLYNNLLGIILIPILIVAYFSSLDFSLILFYLAVPVLFITFLLRLFRLYSIGIIKGISFFYIFLYICTLEILPLVVLYRIFIHK